MKEETTNDRSDIKAKEAYKKELEKNGYTAEIINHPVDIKAVKDGQAWCFEIKKTKHTDKYFGGATMNEWHQALEDPDHFRFVIAIEREGDRWNFIEYTPSQFQVFSTIPPFKVYFNINFERNLKTQSDRKTKAKKMNEDNFIKMEEVFHKLQEK